MRRSGSSRPPSRHTARPHLPIETRGIIADWDPGRQHLTVHVGNQAPHPYRSVLAGRLGLKESRITVISPDVGGGFGQKIALYREELVVAALSRHLCRPVRWREDRFENLLAAAHAREDWARTRRRGGPRRAAARAEPGAGRGFRRVLLLSRQLPGAGHRHDPERPLPAGPLCLRREGGADQ